ncbi:MAG: OPT/YSL family transporter, partial [Nitrospirales bacterium]
MVGLVFKILVDYVGIFRGSLHAVTERASRLFYYGSDISPMLVGVGLIVRLNVACLIFLGGAMGWIIGIPLLGMPPAEWFTGPDWVDRIPTNLDKARELWSRQIRYVGVGAMVVG